MDASGNVDGKIFYSDVMGSVLSISLQKLNLTLKFINLNTKAAKKYGIEPSIYIKPKINRKMEFEQPYFVTIAPILYEASKLSNFYYVLTYVGTFSIQFWNTFNALQQLMGMPSTVPPHNVVYKIFMFCFAIIGLSYASTFYSSIVDMTLIRDNSSFDSFEKILNSRFDIYTEYKGLLSVFNYSIDTSVKKLTIQILLSDERKGMCLRQLQLGQKIICIDGETNVKSYF